MQALQWLIGEHGRLGYLAIARENLVSLAIASEYLEGIGTHVRLLDLHYNDVVGFSRHYNGDKGIGDTIWRVLDIVLACLGTGSLLDT